MKHSIDMKLLTQLSRVLAIKLLAIFLLLGIGIGLQANFRTRQREFYLEKQREIEFRNAATVRHQLAMNDAIDDSMCDAKSNSLEKLKSKKKKFQKKRLQENQTVRDIEEIDSELNADIVSRADINSGDSILVRDAGNTIDRDMDQDMRDLADREDKKKKINKVNKEDKKQKDQKEREERNKEDQEKREDNKDQFPEDSGNSSTSFDRKRLVRELVNSGAMALENSSLSSVCDAFSHTKEFVKGELYLFLYDDKGVCLAHGQQSDLIWQNQYNVKGPYGRYIVRDLIKKAKDGGGWVSYEWRGATKYAYIKPVIKDGKFYVLGSGYYRHDKEDTVVNLVQSAAQHFTSGITNGRAPTELFGELSYPIGPFIRGDLYLYAIDHKGVIRAHARYPNRIGLNAWSATDERGMLVTQKLIEAVNKESDGAWIEYTTHKAFKRVYGYQVQDANKMQYYIAAGYYPEESQGRVRDLVHHGVSYVSSNGIDAASEAFTAPRNDTFREGRMYLAMYDAKGLCLAHGGNPELVGRSYYAVRDEDGREYVRDLLNAAASGGGWVTAKLNGVFKLFYAERANLGISEVTVVSGFYPASKRETMKLMVKTAVKVFIERSRDQALAAFVKKNGQFIRGDLQLFVFGTDGTCYTYGDRHALIWRNLMDVKDDDDRPFVRELIEATRTGIAEITYKLNGMPVTAYAERVTKEGIEYVVGSSYYQ